MAKTDENKGENIGEGLGGDKAKKTNKGWANLKPAKKGEVRNPKGRGKGVLDFRTRVEMAIDFLTDEFVKKHNSNPVNKDKQITKDDVDIMGDVFSQYVNMARNGNLKAMDSLFDRAYGKAKQTVELKNPEGEAFKLEMVRAEKEIEEWEKGWFKNKKDGNNTTNKSTKKQDKN